MTMHKVLSYEDLTRNTYHIVKDGELMRNKGNKDSIMLWVKKYYLFIYYA